MTESTHATTNNKPHDTSSQPIHRGSNLTRMATTSLIVALILFATVFVAFNFWLPTRPAAIFERAMVRSLELQPSELEIKTNGDAQSAINATVRFDSSLNFAAELQRGGQQTQITGYGQDIYIQDPSGKWLSLPLSMAGTLLPAGIAPGTTSSIEKTSIQKIKAVYADHAFINARTEGKRKSIAGKDCQLYVATVETRKLDDFLRAIQKEIPELRVEQKQRESIIKASFLKTPLNVWIDNADGLIRQLEVQTSEQDSIELTIITYGKPFPVSKPESSVPLTGMTQ